MTDTTRSYARRGNKIDKFGLFADAYNIVANGATGKFRTIGLSGGIKKIGCIMASVSTGAGVRIHAMVAGRIIGWNNLTVTTRRVSMTERFGLWHLIGKAGTEVTIDVERFDRGTDKIATTVTKRLFVPTLKAVKFGSRLDY